jgi:IS4 transposase
VKKRNNSFNISLHPEYLRRIKYFDKEQQRTFVFLTNNFSLNATDIAMLYKYRWKVELFFKWIKQHLKIKTFWGTSMNAFSL